MKSDFGMKWKVVKRTPFHGNAERCLILRQLFAKALLSVLSAGKIVINVDETWLPHSDFRRKKWRVKGEVNSVGTKDLTQRVNMIAGIDTEGRIYVSLTQVNTDTDIMLMFLSRLCTVLTRERPDFRSNTVILLDGCSSHKAAATKAHIKALGLTVIYTGLDIELTQNAFKIVCRDWLLINLVNG